MEPAIIVKDGDAVAAYALIVPVASRALVPELFPLFAGLNLFDYKDRPIGPI
ncbi:MAG: hypothetical protein ABI813_04125 [Bacteroidota bacterium]